MIASTALAKMVGQNKNLHLNSDSLYGTFMLYFCDLSYKCVIHRLMSATHAGWLYTVYVVTNWR